MSSAPVTRVISFTGGKGGTGKTTMVINCAVALAQQGRRVLVLDGDLGLANVDIMLGLRPHKTLHDVVFGGASLSEILLKGPAGIDLVPSSSGIEAMCQMSGTQRALLLEHVEVLAADYDYLLIDTQAGIGDDVMYFNAASSEVICVMTPEPTSLTDTYSVIKVLATRFGERRISVVVNNVSALDQAKVAGGGAARSRLQLLEEAAERTFERLQRAVDRFLHVDLRFAGFVPADPAVPDAVRQQQSVMMLYPSSNASRAVASIAKRMDEDFLACRVKGGMQLFFRQLLEVEGAR